MGEPVNKQSTEAAALWLVEVARGRSFPLRDGFTVGRSGGDVQILDPSVSSKHCVFHLSGNALEVEDLGSRNGTFVNGKKLEPHVRLGLLPGVRLEIGKITFSVHAGEPPKPKGTKIELVPNALLIEPGEVHPLPHDSGVLKVANASRTMPRPLATEWVKPREKRKARTLVYLFIVVVPVLAAAAFLLLRR